MKTKPTNRRSSRAGFTFVEFSISMAIATAATAGCLLVFTSLLRSYNESSLMRTAAGRTSMALDRMVFGVGTNPGLREAFSNSISNAWVNGGWKLSYTNSGGTYYFQYSPDKISIVDQANKNICTNILTSTYTYTTSGCQISVTVGESAGGRILTSTMSTYVQFRN